MKTDTIDICNKCSFRRNPMVHVIDLFDEGIFYMNNLPQKRYSANSTTMAVWDLIDGLRTAEKIALVIATIGEVDVTEVEDDIYQILNTLNELEFISEV